MGVAVTAMPILFLLLPDGRELQRNMLISRLSDAYSVDAITEGVGLCPLPPVTHIASLSRASHAFVLENFYRTPIYYYP